jgi:hypothetical protein
MNKTTINLGLTLLFSGSFLVGSAQAAVDTSEDAAPEQGLSQVVESKPADKQAPKDPQADSKTKKGDKDTKSKQSFVVVMSQFFQNMNEGQTALGPAKSATAPNQTFVVTPAPVAAPAPTPAATPAPEKPALSKTLRGVLLDITSTTVFVRHKPSKISGSKSSKTVKTSIANMVKQANQVQVSSLSLKLLSLEELKTLEDHLFELRDFTYEIDADGTRYLTHIK